MKQYVYRTNYQNQDTTVPACVVSVDDPHYSDCFPEHDPDAVTAEVTGLSVVVTHTTDPEDTE
jgi:hypothetical protein